MILSSTSDVVKLITSSTADIQPYASWADQTSSAFTPGRTNTPTITSATTTTIVASPASSTQRQVKTIVIANRHASASNTVTVQHYDGTNTTSVIKVNLLAGMSIEYNGSSWLVYDANGIPVVTSTGLPVTSVSAGDTTLTITPTTGAVVATLNLANTNVWTGAQTFGGSVSDSGATTTFNGSIIQSAKYAKFGVGTPYVPVAKGADFIGNDNTVAGVQIGTENQNGGTSSYNGIYFNNDLASDGLVDHFGFLGQNSSTYTDTTFGTLFAVANLIYMQNTDAPIAYITSHATLGGHKFYDGGTSTTNLVATITKSGITAGLTGSLLGKVNFAGSTSGNILLQGQAVGGSNTITLPAATGTVALTSDLTGYVTHTGGSLTSNAVVLGAGTADTKVSTGITTDGTAKLILGVNATTIGTIKMFGNTSGDVTITPTAAAGTGTVWTLPASTDTFVGKATTDAFTNKTLTNSNNVLGGVTMTLGSDATGDIYYRNSSGFLTRLGIGSSTQVLTVSGGLPTWATGGGSVAIGAPVGSSTNNQLLLVDASGNLAQNSALTFTSSSNFNFGSFGAAQVGFAVSGAQTSMGDTAVTNTYVSVDAFNGKLLLKADNSYDGRIIMTAYAGLQLETPETTVGGSTSGNAYFTQPLIGPKIKKVIIRLSSLLGTASYTFPTAFSNTPIILTTNGLAAAIVTSLSTSAVTVTGSTSTGFLILEGY